MPENLNSVRLMEVQLAIGYLVRLISGRCFAGCFCTPYLLSLVAQPPSLSFSALCMGMQITPSPGDILWSVRC